MNTGTGPAQDRDRRVRRTSDEDRVLPERGASLWRLVAGPAIWAAHFLLSYVTVAIWCAKASRFAPPGNVRTVLWIYTALALSAIVLFGWRGLRQHRWGSARLPHDAASAGDRHRFLGFASFLLCGLAFVAVLYSALAIALVGSCR
jgi:hypothetical protein